MGSAKTPSIFNPSAASIANYEVEVREVGRRYASGSSAKRRLASSAELFYFVPTFAAEPTGSLRCA